jgi:hypothetical protein
MRYRLWYIALLAIPATLGNSNVRQGGEFLPGAAAGLLLAVIIIGLVEMVRIGIRFIRRV